MGAPITGLRRLRSFTGSFASNEMAMLSGPSEMVLLHSAHPGSLSMFRADENRALVRCEYCGRYGPLGSCEGCGAPNRPAETPAKPTPPPLRVTR